MPNADAEKWNAIYHAGGHDRAEPVHVLQHYSHLLPVAGYALDLACGTGANAIFLAQHGLRTAAWDISTQAILRLQEKAAGEKCALETRVCDVTAHPPPAETFDVIVVSYFLERTLLPAIINALKKNGLLYYQTFIRERVSDKGPHNEDYRLERNELLRLCQGLHIVLYHEEGRIGDIHTGFRDEAMLIGQRR